MVFPHHENEIAQSRAANQGSSFVNYWMHNGFVNVDSEKMSKSLGNFFTIRDVLREYHPLTLRFFLLGTQYRSPINYSTVTLVSANGIADFELRMAYWFVNVSGRIWQPTEATNCIRQ